MKITCDRNSDYAIDIEDDTHKINNIYGGGLYHELTVIAGFLTSIAKLVRGAKKGASRETIKRMKSEAIQIAAACTAILKERKR